MISPRIVIAALLSLLILSPSFAQIASQVVNSVAVGSIIGLGTGVATALGINVGSAGAPVTNGGALGTPSSGIATNLSGTAASLTAGTVTTNANLTGDVTSSGNATTIAANAVTNAKAAQMANSTIKGRTTSGTGNSEDLTAAQAAAIIGSVGGALKTKAIRTTYDLSTATGTQAITGFGFIPTSCTVYAGINVSSASYVSVAASDSSRAYVGYYISAGLVNTYSSTTNFIILADATQTNIQVATIQSYDADGLTLSWTKTASPSGTASIDLMCSR